MVRGYGFEVVTQRGTYLPLLFWLALLLAAWGVSTATTGWWSSWPRSDRCARRTHMPYLGLSLGMGTLCVAWLVWDAARHRSSGTRSHDRSASPASCRRCRGCRRWPISSPHDPGNLRMIADYFREPPDDPVGTVEGVRLVLRHLDVFRPIGGAFGADGHVTRAGSTSPAALPARAGARRLARRRDHGAAPPRQRAILGLHVVIGWSLVLAAVSMSRIFGKVWYYLTLWAWTTTALVVVSIIWTAVVVLGRRLPARRSTVTRGAAGVVAAVGVLSWGALTVEALGARVPEQHLSDTLRVITGPTVDALESGDGLSAGADGTYVVTWNDARYFGSQGYGLVNELERRGFDVGVPFTWRVPVTPQRVVTDGEADAEIRLATGFYVDQVADAPGAELVVEYDPRDADDLAEARALESELTDSLRELGLDDLVPLIESNLFGVQLDPRVPVELQEIVDRLLELGTPTAVFLVPVGTDR
ncbi:MAG: hypothetical protein R2713_23865 [Ilumatobacteraceae bacterium]